MIDLDEYYGYQLSIRVITYAPDYKPGRKPIQQKSPT